MATTEGHTKKFHDIFEKAKKSKFDHEYRIDTCEIPKEPNMCLVFQFDKKLRKMDMTLLGREAAEAFSTLYPINEDIIRQYKGTKEFQEKRKLYMAVYG